MTFDKILINQSKLLLDKALKAKVKIASAESCTAGLIAALITEIPGSSQIFDRAFITYSNQAKQEMLGVSKALLEKYGAVSNQVAQAMAIGAMNNSAANLTIAVTGIAGPDGDTAEKQVGLVYIASYNKLNNKLINNKFNFSGNRSQIRNSAVKKAMSILISQM